MGTKICSMCGQELPLENFVKNRKCKDGYGSHCKECHNKKYPYHYREKTNKKVEVKDAPVVPDSVKRELEENNLLSFPPRLLIAALRYHGYRGELQKVTVETVVI
jgi:hypothetical protein